MDTEAESQRPQGKTGPAGIFALGSSLVQENQSGCAEHIMGCALIAVALNVKLNDLKLLKKNVNVSNTKLCIIITLTVVV